MDLTMPMRCPKGHLSTDAEYCSECGAKMPDAASGLGSTVTSGLPASSASSSSAAGDSDRICPDCGTPRANATAVFCEVCRYNFVTHASWATPTVSSPPLAPLAQSIPTQAAPFVDVAAPVAPPSVPSMAVSFAPPASDVIAAPVTPATLADAAPANAAIEDQKSKLENSNGLTQAPVLRWEVVVRVDPSLYTDPDPQIPCPVGEPERVYSLDFADNLIGRRSEKRDIHPEINLNDACVSHRHAKIQRQPDGTFALLDVGSTNGTRLNSVEIQPAVRTPLHDGDQITLGCWTRILVRGLRG